MCRLLSSHHLGKSGKRLVYVEPLLKEVGMYEKAGNGEKLRVGFCECEVVYRVN